ncbi:MAG: winged helix-turn-helix domain-containing protein, partial [Deltaproteobacteria bacterium]|nr:winged helix-turn-helix domain-containing protein [Deltaproteobacteria bacterium]
MELAIFTGELNPHDRFPSERELAERYGVSRPVVREAMTHLTQL